MIMDFSELKEIGENIFEMMDHATLFNPTDENLKFFQEHGFKTLTFPTKANEDPTAEVTCKWVYRIFRAGLDERGLEDVTIDFVRMWENKNSMAEYSE